MNQSVRVWCAYVAVVALLAAPVLGFSHAAIPHTHTHAHDNALHSVIEHGLDSSLSRKEFAVALVAPWIALFALISIAIGSQVPAFVYALHPYTQRLRRGIARYRTFR